jgi:hypothetical protein
MDFFGRDEESPLHTVRNKPTIVIAWDPDVLSDSEYAELVVAIGDLVRARGGEGIERLDAQLAAVLRGVCV